MSQQRVQQGYEATGVFRTGTPIGIRAVTESPESVYIPPDTHGRIVHIIGAAGSGTSTLMETMILDHVYRGEGVAILDPHGCLTNRLLYLLPREAIERTICLSPGDPDWAPIWNPLQCGAGTSRDQLAGALVRAIVPRQSSFGDRIEHLLGQVFFAVLHLIGGTVLDAVHLLRWKSAESRHLRERLLRVITNEPSRSFWLNDFDHYERGDLSLPLHKLSKLMMPTTVAKMLSQRNSAISFRDVIDTGKILLVDLSHLDVDVQRMLGRLILSLLHLAALARSSGQEQSPKLFHIYCDEAHRFLGDAVEGLISQPRSSKTRLILAHCYLDQLGQEVADEILATSSTIVFRVNARDAHRLETHLRGKVGVEELITLTSGQAIARIGDDIVRVRTNPPLAIRENGPRDEIITRSRNLYCVPAEQIQWALR